jgi:hypothetical protein
MSSPARVIGSQRVANAFLARALKRIDRVSLIDKQRQLILQPNPRHPEKRGQFLGQLVDQRAASRGLATFLEFQPSPTAHRRNELSLERTHSHSAE